MKEIHVAFPPALSRVVSVTANGVKYINSNFRYEESAPASPNHEQSKSATETTETGCRDHCTTAVGKVQEGECEGQCGG